MYKLICDKHNIKLECMSGEPAHRANWYCPKCFMLDTMTGEELVDEIQSLQSDNAALREALEGMDDLTYSFDSRKRMEEIRNKALGVSK